MAPRVSVVINNCNYGRYLAIAINSALTQDFPVRDTEVIVVDDGSTDNSKEVIASFHDRVRPIFQSNQGQAAALNAGFAASKGEIVCLLDSDDWWRKDKISKVVDRFEEDEDLGMVQHWTLEVDNQGRRLSGALPEIPRLWTVTDYLRSGAVFTGTTGLSFRRKIVEKILPIPRELRICADEYLYYTIFQAPVGNISEPLGFRRVHGSNRYAMRYGDPRRLEEHRLARSVLHRELDLRLEKDHLHISGNVERQWKIEEAMGRLFLARYYRRWSEAVDAWRDVRLLLPAAGYAQFKRMTLLLALVSPGIYLFVHGLYSKLPLIVSLRSKWLREA